MLKIWTKLNIIICSVYKSILSSNSFRLITSQYYTTAFYVSWHKLCTTLFLNLYVILFLFHRGPRQAAFLDAESSYLVPRPRESYRASPDDEETQSGRTGPQSYRVQVSYMVIYTMDSNILWWNTKLVQQIIKTYLDPL